MLALAIGLAWHDFERYVLSGFSFEITHAYADNPLVAERGKDPGDSLADVGEVEALRVVVELELPAEGRDRVARLAVLGA